MLANIYENREINITSKGIKEKIIGLLFIAALFGMIVLGIGLLGIGVYHSGSTAPIIVHVGIFMVSIEVTNNPECSPMLAGCLVIPSSPNTKYFAVWGAMTLTKSGDIYTTSRKIIKIPVP